MATPLTKTMLASWLLRFLVGCSMMMPSLLTTEGPRKRY